MLQAADFRKGYGNWRSKKSKGARGETGYLLDKEKLHATDVQHEDVSFEVLSRTAERRQLAPCLSAVSMSLGTLLVHTSTHGDVGNAGGGRLAVLRHEQVSADPPACTKTRNERCNGGLIARWVTTGRL